MCTISVDNSFAAAAPANILRHKVDRQIQYWLRDRLLPTLKWLQFRHAFQTMCNRKSAKKICCLTWIEMPLCTPYLSLTALYRKLPLGIYAKFNYIHSSVFVLDKTTPQKARLKCRKRHPRLYPGGPSLYQPFALLPCSGDTLWSLYLGRQHTCAKRPQRH